jgi:hypothetical protein
MNNADVPANPRLSVPASGWAGFVNASMWAVGGIFALLAWRQLELVNTHAVNLMYGDQFDIYQPMFLGQGWWDTFALQHGPHREGAGLVVTRAMGLVSGWDSRWDAFAASIVMIGAAALGLVLARRFGIARNNILLAAVPLLFFNVHQYEIFVGAVNLSYASMPMLLFMAYCLSWFLHSDVWRFLAVGMLTFLLIFTGFGLFVGFLTPPLLIVEAVQALRTRERGRALLATGALAIACVGWALFAKGYTFQPAVTGFRFPYEHPLEYVVFVGRMLGNFYGTAVLSAWELILGLVVSAALVAICAWNGIRSLSRGVAQNRQCVVLFCLSAFALLFCANCAVGRVFTSAIAPLAPRYVSLLIPAGLAIFLQLSLLGNLRGLGWAAMAYAVLLIPGTSITRTDEIYGANWYAEGRRSWKAAYLSTHDEAKADQLSHFSIYPAPLGERLTFLEDHRLNLFLPPPSE